MNKKVYKKFSYEYNDEINYIKCIRNKFGYFHWKLPIVLSEILTYSEEAEKNYFDNLHKNFELKNTLNSKYWYPIITIYEDETKLFGETYKINFIQNSKIKNDFVWIKRNKINFFYKNWCDDSINIYTKLIQEKLKIKLKSIIDQIFKEKNNNNPLQINYSTINDSLQKSIIISWNDKFIIKFDKNKIYISLQILYFKENIIKQMIIYSLSVYHNKFNPYKKIELWYMQNFKKRLIENKIVQPWMEDHLFVNFQLGEYDE